MKRFLSIFSAILIMASTLSLSMTLTSCGGCASVVELETAVALANEECPLDCGDGMYITKIYTEGSNVVFRCEAPSDVVAALNDPYGYSAAHDAMVEMANYDSDTRELVELCIDAEYGMTFLYIDEYGYSAEVSLSYRELARL